MSHQHSTKEYYHAARKLLPQMNDVMRKSVESLLRKAEQGINTENQIIEIISVDKTLCSQLRNILDDGEVTMGVDFSILAGDPSSPDALKFICPEPNHDFTRRIQKIGQDPGICPYHKKPLIPIAKKKGVH